MTMKPSDEPTGEAYTEFEKYDAKGPFKCGNCIHMQGYACVHPVMVSRSQQPRNKDGYPKVSEGDCCKFVRRRH